VSSFTDPTSTSESERLGEEDEAVVNGILERFKGTTNDTVEEDEEEQGWSGITSLPRGTWSVTLVVRWLILRQAIESSGDESEESVKNEKGTRMTTNKVEDQKDIT